MAARGISVIGWGFSYQAKDSKTNNPVCDFEFKSGTFNTGDLFGKALGNAVHMSRRGLQQKMSDFLRINFNYMRAYNIRTMKDFSPVDKFLTERRHYFKYVPGCCEYTTACD